MASHTPLEDDPKQLEGAQNFWTSFTHGAKWSIIATVVVLVGLAIAFVPTGG